MKLSICIANTNHAKLLENALNSIYHNPPKCSFEVLVVDNASNDNSVEMVRKRFPKVILTINKSRLGYPANSNINMRKSKGEYFLILNEDIEIQKDSLDTGIDYMEQNLDVGLLGCCMLSPDGKIMFTSGRRFPTILNESLGWLKLSERFPKNRIFGRYLMSYWPHDTIREVETVQEAGMLVRRKAVEKVGMMDENLFFSYDGPEWTRRFRKNEWKVVYHPDVKIMHYHGQSSNPEGKVNVFLLTESMKSSLYYYRKYHSENYVKIYRACMIVIFMAYYLKHKTRAFFLNNNNNLQLRMKTARIMLLFYLFAGKNNNNS